MGQARSEPHRTCSRFCSIAHEAGGFLPRDASARAFQDAISASSLNIKRTPLPPWLTRILPPFRALCSASQAMTSGSSLVRPLNSSTPAMSSCLRDVFGRFVSADAREASARVADVADVLRARLVLLRVPEHADAYRRTLPQLWRAQDALARITRLPAEGVEGELAAFLPRVS